MAEPSASPTTDPPPLDPPLDPKSGTILVTIRYFAAAKAAAGIPHERLRIPTVAPEQGHSIEPDGVGEAGRTASCVVGSVLDAAVDRHGPGLARVLQRCSYLLDEIAVHGRRTQVRDGQVLDVLPPFAGG